MPLSPVARIVTSAFLVSGTAHVVRPRLFEPLMPAWVPAHRTVVVGSGVAELACAAGLVHRPTRRLAALVGAALLIAVFPGNVQMALDASRRGGPRRRALAYARLPLQAPMIRSMLETARRAR